MMNSRLLQILTVYQTSEKRRLNISGTLVYNFFLFIKISRILLLLRLMLIFIWHLQSSALIAVSNISEYLDEEAVRTMVLPRIIRVFQDNPSDVNISLFLLAATDRILDKLGRSLIIDEVLPTLTSLKLQDPEVIVALVSK